MTISRLPQLILRHCEEEDALMERMLHVQGYETKPWQHDPYRKYVESTGTQVELRLAAMDYKNLTCDLGFDFI